MRRDSILVFSWIIFSLTGCSGGEEASEQRQSIVDMIFGKEDSRLVADVSVQVDSHIGFIRGSSTVADIEGYSFQPGLLKDGDLETCWQEGNKKSSGKGEWVTVFFDTVVDITEIRLANGCQQREGKYGDLFINNSRPSVLQISNEGASTQAVMKTWQISRVAGWQDLKVDFKEVTQLTFKIQDVYKGSRWQDASISEISFNGSSSQSKGPPVALPSGTYCYQNFHAQGYVPNEATVYVSGRKARWHIVRVASELMMDGEGVVTTSSVIGLSKTFDIGIGERSYESSFKVTSGQIDLGSVRLSRVPCDKLSSFTALGE
jgi:hypothetical protein